MPTSPRMPWQRRGIKLKGHSAPRRGVLLPSAAKVPKNAVQTCGLKIPRAPSLTAYPTCFHHANAMPRKFHLNVASSLLLFCCRFCSEMQGCAAMARTLSKRRPSAATYLCREAAKARFDNRPPRVGVSKGEGRSPPLLVVSRLGDFQGGREIEIPSPLNGVLWLLSFDKERK